jgi:hypothetical protein
MKLSITYLIKRYTLGLVLLASFIFSSCSKFVATDTAPSLVSIGEVYKTDATATAAVSAMYSYSNNITLLGNISYLDGIYADELQYTGTSTNLLEFAGSNISSTNSSSESNFWTYSYYMIGQANLAIDGLTNSTTLTPSLKSQLLGEAKFFRAFAFFYLAHHFGGVPLSLSATQIDNAFLPRSAADEIWAQVISDLKDAEALLPTAYAGTSGQRGRVNKWAAAALLARTYLYNKDYVNAEAQATLVISSGTYSLDALSNVFINTSKETILQFATYYGYSTFGPNYRTTTSATTVAPPIYVLYPTFTNSFEPGDTRKTSWVDSKELVNVGYNT